MSEFKIFLTRFSFWSWKLWRNKTWKRIWLKSRFTLSAFRPLTGLNLDPALFIAWLISLRLCSVFCRKILSSSSWNPWKSSCNISRFSLVFWAKADNSSSLKPWKSSWKNGKMKRDYYLPIETEQFEHFWAIADE